MEQKAEIESETEKKIKKREKVYVKQALVTSPGKLVTSRNNRT